MSIRNIVFAVCATTVGAAGLWTTSEYVPQARHFPQAMFAIIFASGLIILVQALRRPASKPASSPADAAGRALDGGPGTPMHDDGVHVRGGVLRGALPFALTLIAWALAVSYGAGYLLPGFLAGTVLMVIAGSRSVVRVIFGSAAVVLFCFMMFYVVFQTRIPETAVVRELFAPLRNLI